MRNLCKYIPPNNLIWPTLSHDQEEEHLAIGSAGQKLVITKARVTDTGVYECRAENAAGGDKLGYHLEVYGG